MKKRCFILFLAIYFFITNIAVAQSAMQEENNDFPKSFIGNWKGKLQCMECENQANEFNMQIRLHPTDSVNQYSFQTIYEESGKPLITENDRFYILKPVDIKKGHWIVDEKNGIVIDNYVHGNSIHGSFTVQGNTIVNNYWIENDTLYAEFFFIKLEENKNPSDRTNPVINHKITSYQKAVLTKAD